MNEVEGMRRNYSGLPRIAVKCTRYIRVPKRTSILTTSEQLDSMTLCEFLSLVVRRGLFNNDWSVGALRETLPHTHTILNHAVKQKLTRYQPRCHDHPRP